MAEKPQNTPQAASKKPSRKKKSDRRNQVLSILGMIFGVVVLLSILAYHRQDEAVLDRLTILDIGRIAFNDQVKALAAGIQNKFGLVGALVADFFVVHTVGFVSIAIPVLGIMWGWILLGRREKRTMLTITNYTIVLLLLISATAGVAGAMFEGITKEWYGSMGSYTADILIRLLGTVGASIILLTTLFITAVFAVDLDVHKSIERFRMAGLNLYAWFMKKREVQLPFGSDEAVTIRKNSDEPVRQRPSEVVIAERPDMDEDVPEEEMVGLDRSAGDSEITEPVARELHLTRADSSRSTPRQSSNEPPVAVLPDVADEEIDYVFPSVDLLDTIRQADPIDDEELKANAELVRAKLAHFGVEIESVSVTPGPVITLYELVPASGVKISRIVALADDLALALAAKGIRIMAPIPGKSAVGVEIPNRNPSIVYLRSVLNSTKFRESKATLPLAFGKTISGEALTDDLAKMPHLLIAGSTGSGKSVGINTILAGLLFRMHPSEVKFVIIDPKKIELTPYGRLKRHFLAVSPDINEEIITTPENAVSVLKSVELEMEKRYDKLAAAGVRNVQDYNERLKSGRLKNTETIVHRKMPYLIVVIDELADLMMTAAREVEAPIARLAQLARAVGIHLVLATQRPSVDVITGVIKANFPARIAYQVASKTDSRTILDMNGAEQLLGSGDMLYLPSGSPKPMRIQNAYISSEEVERLTDHIANQQGYSQAFQLPSILERKSSGMRGGASERDEFFEEAARLIVRHQQGSVSLLQRRLKVGYSRAARLVDELEAAGVVGPFDGSKARLVLIDSDDQLDRLLESLEG